MDGSLPDKKHHARLIGLAAICVCLIPVASVSADAPSLSAKRASWTAEELYSDFLAEFGTSPDACYTDYRLHGAPPLPNAPETLGQRWSSAIVAIDASGSMQRRVEGTPKIAVAKAAVQQFVRSAPRGAHIGLLAFGHRGSSDERGKALSCTGIEMLSGPALSERKPLSKVLDGLQAKGWTPLADAITTAGDSVARVANNGQSVVLVVSDGLETCGGDPVAAAKAVHESESKTIVNIIGLDVSPQDRGVLEEVAKAGGGIFVHAANAQELEAQLRVTYTNPQDAQAYDAAALQIKKENVSQALSAANHASACVLDISHQESAQFLDMSHDMVNTGQIDAAIVPEAYRLLKALHEEQEADMHAFSDQAKAELERINNRIDRDRRRVTATYEDLP